MMIAKERISTGDWVPPWLRFQHEERYRFAAQRAAGRTVLDVACGIGYGSEMLRNSGAARVIGGDLEIDAVRQAVALTPATGLSFIHTSATALPFADHTFDLIVSLETIEHIVEDEQYVREARRVLRNGGTFVCSTPNRAVMNPGRGITDRPFNPFHVREYTVEELTPLLRKHFEGVQWFGQTGFGNRYVWLTQWTGRHSPMLAVRIHQMCKLLLAPFDRRSRHTPVPLPAPGAAPEVLVAVCTT